MAGFSKRPELLAPAGNWECARAAVANGADAIFFGLELFNARMRADNFTVEDLPSLMEYLHSHGVRGYVTMNVLVFTREMLDAVQHFRHLHDAGVDAVIVQDLGMASLLKTVAPGVHLHASTQMTLTSPEGMAWAKRVLDLDLAVLSRELSLKELSRFKANEEGALPIEVFVHGALCVAYSGQCLTSESLGRRSANRGECAQACRLPYEMIVDGALKDLGDRRYLLSPQDLAAVAEVPKLAALGVRSFKIEGRLKSPEYVAAVTRVYRRAIDEAMKLEADALGPYEQMESVPLQEIPVLKVPARDRYELEMTFSRGLFTGWMHGVNHQKLVAGRFGKKRGPFVGKIQRVGRDEVEISRLGSDEVVELHPGDGVVFDTGGDTNREEGGRIYSIRPTRKNQFVLGFQNGRIDSRRLKVGDRVWKTDDPALNVELRQSLQKAAKPAANMPWIVRASGKLNKPLRIEVTCEGQLFAVESEIALSKAEKRPLTEEMLREQLGRLGGTRFYLKELEWVVLEANTEESEASPGLMMPVSELNRLRRELVSLMEDIKPNVFRIPPFASPEEALEERLRPIMTQRRESLPQALAQEARLTVLCRDFDQLQSALEAGVDRVYLDLEDLRRCREGVLLAKSIRPDVDVFLATPRIQKPGEAGFFKLIERAEPDGILVRNLGALAWFSQNLSEGEGATKRLPLVGDFSLNVANPLTAGLLIREGLEKLTISYDLNLEQVCDLIQTSPPHWYEVTLHQHMPMFHMEHCAFAAFLSEGTDFTNCGRPCEKHKVSLRDRVGMEHPLMADAGCRNTLFNATAQSGADFFDTLFSSGIRSFRIDLLRELPAETRQVISAYRALLNGSRSAQQVLNEVRAISKLGVTTGTYED